ncbi:MAG: hypothetical protein P1U56_03440 [Saprospiraceae bacterium]|nr:hypothetical protein [Saprospiraceae bacterium]
MFRIIPFDEIEKNKWNGTIHYAINGNVYGYYWYLKAVIGEWDAIVEEDYESVMPIITKPLKPHQYNLLKELGPYSVNPLTDQRVGSMLDLLQTHNRSSVYAVHSQVSKRQLATYKTTSRSKAVLPGGSKYEDLSRTYSDDLSNAINIKGYDSVKIVSGLKPELLVELLSENDMHKNALMRLMYNAMHRGIGFSSAIQDKASGKTLAASFFINSNTTLTEILSYYGGGKKYRQLIFDLMLRNNSGSPFRYETFVSTSDLHEMGFDSEPVFDLHFKTSAMTNIMKSFGQAY